jgi:hypothetical protein
MSGQPTEPTLEECMDILRVRNALNHMGKADGELRLAARATGVQKAAHRAEAAQFIRWAIERLQEVKL